MKLFILLLDLSLPLEDPVLQFLVVLIIIFAAPLLLNKVKIPHLIGLIVAGAVIGPNGFNILPREGNIMVTGTTGLLYIMFLAGLEIDLPEFKVNKWKSLTFGWYTFIIPLVIGLLAGHYLLNFTWLTALLFASLFSTHTLIAYPILSKLGIVKNRAVNITVGGTMITDILALLVLAIVVGVTRGEVNTAFWIRLLVSFGVFAVIVLWGFPILGRKFFKKEDDKISQYIFVLIVIYLASLFAEMAGLEAVIGAFFAGLALNRLIPHTSTLMNRIDFVGNAIFIPFFLISVGMLINYKVFFSDTQTLLVMVVMLAAAVPSKYIAAWLTQKSFKLTRNEGGLIFGLSVSHAAAILAVVIVGYNTIIGETEAGEPIRLLNDSVLNGSIAVILVSCTLSSFLTQKYGEKILQAENVHTLTETNPDDERILLALNYENTIEPLTNLALMLKAKKNTENIFALNVVNVNTDESSASKAEKILDTAVKIGASADTRITPRVRFDHDVQNGIANAIRESKITDLILGVDKQKGFTHSFTYNLYYSYLKNDNVNVFVYHEVQPVSTIKTHSVIMAANAHREPGFFHALAKVWNIARNAGATMAFYGHEDTIKVIERIKKKVNIPARFNIFNDWSGLPALIRRKKADEGLILFMAERGRISYDMQMNKVPNELNGSLGEMNCLLIYPYGNLQVTYPQDRNVNDPAEFAEIGNIIQKIFK